MLYQEAHQHKNDVGAEYSGVWELAPHRFHAISRGLRSFRKLSRWQQLGAPARVARLPDWVNSSPTRKTQEGAKRHDSSEAVQLLEGHVQS